MTLHKFKQKEPTMHTVKNEAKQTTQTVGKGPFHDHTFGKHWKPPPVALSKAKDDILSGAIAASLQAIIPPVLTITTSTTCSTSFMHD